MTNSKETPELLASIINLKPEYKDQLHPYAVERYLSFLNEIYDKFSQGQLTVEDLELYLSEEEQVKLNNCATEIAEWLAKCRKDSGEASLVVYLYSRHSYSSMSRFKAVLKTALERKAEKQRQEAEKQRRLAVLKEIDPPLADAKKYLTSEETQRFLDSIPGAIDAYLDRDKRAESYSPGIWLLTSKASDYSYWILIIKERKEKEARKKRAEIEHSQFVKEINDTIKKLKQELAKVKKPGFAYPTALAKYDPDSWCELERPTREEVERWAGPYIRKRVPEALRNFVSWDLDWQVQTLPYAKYEVLGVPCLTWCFRTLVLVEVHLKLIETKFTREFHGYEYQMKVEAENLGSFCLGPVEWDHHEGFSVPVHLLALLAESELERPGIEIFIHDASHTVYTVEAFDDYFVELQKEFIGFIKTIGKDGALLQELRDKGLIDEDTGKLIEEKAKLPLPQSGGAEASAGQSIDDDSDVFGALAAMGYKTAESKKAIEAAHLSPGMSLEEKVKGVLKNMGM